MARLKLNWAGLGCVVVSYLFLLLPLLLRPLHTHTHIHAYEINARAEGRHTYTGSYFFTGAKKGGQVTHTHSHNKQTHVSSK